MTTILGIDPDTRRIAYCKLVLQDDGSLHLGGVGTILRKQGRTSNNFHENYASRLREVLYPIIDDGGTVYIESVFCRSRSGFASLSHVQGELRYEIGAIRGKLYIAKPVLPTVWQYAVGSYLAVPFKKRGTITTKDCSILCATKILGFCPSSEHEADATCIAYYGIITENGLDPNPKSPLVVQ